MSTTQRVVRKQLAGAEDLLQGVGIVTQTRGSGSYPIHKLDIPIPTYDIAEMQASSAEFMRLYGTDTAYTDYRRNPEGTVGIPSNLGGVWEPMRSLEYLVCGNFATGAYVFSSDCVVALDQQSYNWQGSVPKVVAAGATPATSGGIGAGAWVDRTVQGKLRESVSVTDFYANGFSGVRVDPTGAVDSTAGIQAALNSGAKRVHAPAGSYLTTAVLYVPSGVEFVGDGKGNTRIVCQTSSVTGSRGIVKSAIIALDGVCPLDNYTTYSSSTGDFFTTGPKAFAAASTIKSGTKSFTAANSGDVSGLTAGQWLHMAEGIPAWHPAKSEFVQVASVSGTTVSLKTSLRNSYANTTTSLGAFIRSYTLTASPGGGGAGYPDMSTWADAGFRPVTPVSGAAVRDMSLVCNQTGSVSKIGWIAHLAVGCTIDVEVVDGTFWCLDSQDMTINVSGGTAAASSSYLGNGVNGITCNIDISNQLAVEEGAQNVVGVVRSLGYNSVIKFCSNIDINWTATADAVPALQVGESRNVTIRPTLRSRSNAVKVYTPDLAMLAPALPQAFLTGEPWFYYGCGLTLDGGECISLDSPTMSIECAGGGQVRCIDTVVPVAQTSRYKGTQIVGGSKVVQSVSTSPLFADLEAGEEFISTTYGGISVTGVWSSTISQQFNFGTGTLDTLIVDNLGANNVQVGDVVVFRLSDSAAAPTNWSWHVAEVTAVHNASSAIKYSPANPAARTAITAANEDRILVFRVSKRFAQPALIVPRSGADARYGGNIASIGTTYGGPLQLGAYHLWVDSSGRLRIKSGAPTSDTDGTVVGAQT